MTEKLEGPIGDWPVIQPNFDFNLNCSRGSGNNGAAVGGRLPEVLDRFRFFWLSMYVTVSWWSSSLRA